MSYLLDSHVVVWLALDRSRLRQATVQRLLETKTLTISVITWWELGIKAHAGRLPRLEALKVVVEKWDAATLPVSRAHAEIAATLPLLHRDPFDRMLVAQAMAEGLTLVTADGRVASYPAPVLRA